MWEPFRLSREEWDPGYRIIYEKFHINSHFLFIGSDLWSMPKVNL